MHQLPLGGNDTEGCLTNTIRLRRDVHGRYFAADKATFYLIHLRLSMNVRVNAAVAFDDFLRTGVVARSYSTRVSSVVKR